MITFHLNWLQLYDIAINLSDEVSLIWRQRWSVGKVLYILTRYTALFDAVVLLWCQSIFVPRPIEPCLTFCMTPFADNFYAGHTIDVSQLSSKTYNNDELR